MQRHKSDLNSVAVAVCTRGRPEMLRATLASLARLELQGIDCHYIVIENHDSHTVGTIVNELTDMVEAGRVTYRIEPRLGIAYARNAALETALGLNVDALAFIDDDEVADPRWLAELLRMANQNGLDLVGGPVGLQPAPADASASEKMVWRGIKARCDDIEAKGRRLAARGDTSDITITTGNWLANLDFVRRMNLRFDETLNLSGGEDTTFFRVLRESGGKTGWTADAIVTESQPRERLTLNYQFNRARDQALARHRAKYPNPSLNAFIVFLGMTIFKTVGGILRILQSFFDSGASLVRAARAFGAIAGMASALRGHRSNHYETVSGR